MRTSMKELNKFIKWSVLGDGYVGRSTHNKDAHYTFERLVGHKDYVELVASKFIGLQDCSVVVKKYTRKDNKQVIQVRTSSHPVFSRVRDRQYLRGRRVVEPHMLTLLDWEAMAYLYMDDGSLVYNSRGSSIVRISTCSYSYYENQALISAIKDKLGVQFSINKAGSNNKSGMRYQLNLLKNSQKRFFDNISKYVVQSYGYKLPEFL